jgi:hypothetical protein
MRIAFHGGYCCGIKTIHGFDCAPSSKIWGLEAQTKAVRDFSGDEDQNGEHTCSEWNFYLDKAPYETYQERFKRYLAYLDVLRPYGVVEAVLINGDGGDSNQIECWEPILLANDFKLVTDCYNSNSGNRIFIYHRKRDYDGS